VILVAAVRDSGIGIPPEQASRIFDSFHQLDEGLSRGYAGLGLGLALVRKLLHLMGGEIEVESQLDQGSTFTIKLPLRVPIAMPEETNEALDGTAAILVVEDNPIGMTVVRHALGRFGLGTDPAVDGEKALEAVRRKHYDLILMDLQMPGMDGYQCAREIRSREKSSERRVGIIALTAHAQESDRHAALAAGMDAYLAKPYSQEQLETAIINVLSAGR